MSRKDISGTEALKKLKELAEDARTCMMSTSLNERPIPTRPMGLQEVDENGVLWFISYKDSDKTYDLKKDSEIQLTFSNDSDNEYLSIYGTAEVYTDQKTIDEHWSAMANAWFDGKEDPNVSIIGVRPKDVRYWDTKHGKMVDYALMLYSAVTNDYKDGGIEGNLNI